MAAITREACRAARGLLDWSQDQLATEAGLESTGAKFEPALNPDCKQSRRHQTCLGNAGASSSIAVGLSLKRNPHTPSGSLPARTNRPAAASPPHASKKPTASNRQATAAQTRTAQIRACASRGAGLVGIGQWQSDEGQRRSRAPIVSRAGVGYDLTVPCTRISQKSCAVAYITYA